MELGSNRSSDGLILVKASKAFAAKRRLSQNWCWCALGGRWMCGHTGCAL